MLFIRFVMLCRPEWFGVVLCFRDIINIYIYICVCVYVSIYIYISISLSVYLYVYIYIFIFIFILGNTGLRTAFSTLCA